MSTLLNDNFNSYPTGSPPPGYTEVSHGGNATWTVENVTGFGSRGVKAVRVTDGEESLLKDNLSLADGWISADIIISGGSANEQPGVTLRAVGTSTWVQARLNNLENTLVVWASGETAQTVAYDWQADVKYHLVVEASGSEVTARVYDSNSVLLVEKSITTAVTSAGQWGLRFVGAVAGATEYWDNLAVGNFDPWDDLPSSGTVVEPHSDLSSSGGVPAHGSVTVKYEVTPVGVSDFSSAGAVNQCNSLQSTGSVAAHGSITVKYEVFERPKVTVGFNPAADAFMLDYTPVLNYGDLADLVAGRYDSKTARALLRFDFSSLRTDLIITEAKLILHGRIVHGTGRIAIRELLGPWEELGVTWWNQPGRSALAEDEQPMAETIEADVTWLFKSWYAGFKANNGVIIQSADEAAEAHVVVCSREWPAAPKRPQLLVTYYAPEGTPGAKELSSSGSIIGHTFAELACSGAVGGDWNDLDSKGRIGRPYISSIGNVRLVANLPSVGTIRGTRVANDFDNLGRVSRPVLPSQGAPRIKGKDDFPAAGYAAERYDLDSVGTPRVPGKDDFEAIGYVSGAANELLSKGVVDYYFDDLLSQGAIRVIVPGDIEATGYVSGAANELPSRGHATGPWMRSSGAVNTVSSLYSKGKARIPFDLSSAGFVTYSDESDLPSEGLPRLRDAADLWSFGNCASVYSDLLCRGHIGAWILEVKTTVKIWPPEGRSV